MIYHNHILIYIYIYVYVDMHKQPVCVLTVGVCVYIIVYIHWNVYYLYVCGNQPMSICEWDIALHP